MRELAIALIMLGVSAAAGAAPPTGAGDWTPTSTQLAELEAHLPKVPGALPDGVQAAVRYYIGQTVNGHRFIVGEIVSAHRGEQPGIRMQPLPIIMDGGCSVINLTYDVAKRSFVGYACNGMA